MVSVRAKALAVLYEAAAKSQSVMNRIIKPGNIKEGAGTRLFPAKCTSNDEKFAFRIDKGEPIHDRPGVYRAFLQINSQATATTLKKAHAKNPHAAISHADIDTAKDANHETLVDIFAQFGDNMPK